MAASRPASSPSEFEFTVAYPWGQSALEGYQAAAEHFGLHTLDDPLMDGSDCGRLLVHADKLKLDAVVQALEEVNERAAEADDETDDTLFAEEQDVLLAANVAYFSHDWRHWDAEADEGALAHLGWVRTMVEQDDGSIRVTLRLLPGPDPPCS